MGTYNFVCDPMKFRWYAFLGIFDLGIQHMLEVLACGHQSVATQDLFLRDFFQTVEVGLALCFFFLLIASPVLNDQHIC